MASKNDETLLRALRESLAASRERNTNHVRRVPPASHLSFEECCRAFEGAENGGVYSVEDLEANIRETVNSPLFTDGTIVRFRFPEGTSDRVRERITRIHAEVCAGWGCDPLWSRDPKA